jgi:hypothetical protein
MPAWMRPEVQEWLVGSLEVAIDKFCRLRDWTADVKPKEIEARPPKVEPAKPGKPAKPIVIVNESKNQTTGCFGCGIWLLILTQGLVQEEAQREY